MDISDQGSHSASGVSSGKSMDSASASSGVSEARVVELVQSQFSEFSSLFVASMEASFANIQSFIEDRLYSHSQNVHDSNCSFSAPSPALVNQAPSQTQTNPSMRNHCIGCGPGGETQEPGQVEPATSSFLAALHAAGIRVPQGVSISDRIVRGSSSEAVQSANVQAGALQGAQAEVPLHSLGVPATGQVNVGASSLSVLRLLYQLCPVAAPEPPPVPCRVCDFEGLFTSVNRPADVCLSYRSLLTCCYALASFDS